jgi:NADP-dependent 3-hydroxy acid dehydrogenase YdfG
MMSVLDKFRLDDKVVIVTGASSGLGVFFAETGGQAGADVVIAARRVEKLAATAQLVTAARQRALSVQTDVADPDQCAAMVDAAIAEFGRVDVLVNNAGVGAAVPATRETADEFCAVVDNNLNGCHWAAQACGGGFVTGQTIVVDGGVTVA